MFSEFAYRINMWRHNVRLHRCASIYAGRNVTIGSGTTVYRNATIAACGLCYDARFRSSPDGSVTIGKRCSVLPGAAIAAYGGDIRIGDDVSINPYTILYGHGGLTIGDKSRIAAHTVIVPANHIFEDPSRPIMHQGLTQNGITIGRDVWIGARVTILDGVTIGDGSVIGAGATIYKSIPAGAVVVGQQFRIIRSRFEPTTIPDDSHERTACL